MKTTRGECTMAITRSINYSRITEQSVTFCDHLWNPMLYRRSFIVITWKRILLVSKEHVFNFLLFFLSFSYRFFCFLLVILYLLNISRSSGSTKPFALSWLNVKSFPALIQMETLFFNRYYIPYCIFEIYWNTLKSNFSRFVSVMLHHEVG